MRTVLHLHPALAPFKAAVLPLSKKLGAKAEGGLRTSCRRTSWWTSTTPVPSASATAVEDEIGTPYCITVDFQTVGDEAKGAPPTTASPSATATPWSRSVSPSPS